MSDFDVIVVGTRCAGASLAMLLAREGYRVLGIDRAHFPSDTLSTRFLWPRTTHFLEAWGLLDRLAANRVPQDRHRHLHYGSEVLRGQPNAVEGTSAMYCPRRTVLDALLVTAAREGGADIRERVTVRHLCGTVSASALARLLSPATRLVSLASPQNPSGVAIPRTVLRGAFGHGGALPGCAPAARRNLPMRRLWRRCACTERRDHEPEGHRDRFAFEVPRRARRAYWLGAQRAPVPGVD